MTEGHKEGFSYISPEKQKKNAARLLIFEISVLVLAVCTIFGILVYLGVISLGKDKPVNKGNNTQSTMPEKAWDANLYNVDKSVKPELEVISDVPKKSITMDNKAKLIEFVDRYHVYGRKYYLEDSSYSEIVKKIVLHLTSVEQPSNKYFVSGKAPIASTGMKFNKETLHLYIYLAKEAYEDRNASSGKYFMQSLLMTTYRMAYNPIGGAINQDREKELLDLISKINEEDTKLITIKDN